MAAVYTCSACHGVVARTTVVCPHCHANLSGIRCQSCGFTGPESSFAQDRCPKCGSIVRGIPQRPTAPETTQAVICSAMIPGVGTMIFGHKLARGLVILGLSIASWVVLGLLAPANNNSESPIYLLAFVPLGLWIWGMVDAHKTTQRWKSAHPAAARAGQPATPQRAAAQPATPPAAAQVPAPECRAVFDQDGHVSAISAPQHGTWAIKRSGPATYCSQRAGSLLDATEILKHVESIPGMTYYVVDTPDGSLGRDVNGYYTESPLKTQNLRVASRSGTPAQVEFASLRGQGNDMQEQALAAAMKKSGKYARFILLMECGRCGYKSPVETEAGSLARECYCCGAKNTGTRGSIDVFTNDGSLVTI